MAKTFGSNMPISEQQIEESKHESDSFDTFEAESEEYVDDQELTGQKPTIEIEKTQLDTEKTLKEEDDRSKDIKVLTQSSDQSLGKLLGKLE